MTRTIIALMLSALPAVTAAQINKCIDASGKVVAYGNQCPPGTRAQQTNIPNKPSAAPATAQKSLAEREAEFRKRRMEEQEAAVKRKQEAAESAQRKEACAQARTYLKGLQAGQRTARTDPKTGERVFLRDDEYPREIAAAQRAVAEHCK